MNPATTLRITYVDGPTAILEIGKVRFRTDPTFDCAGSLYRMPTYALSKLQPPAIGLALLFMGAARVQAASPHLLTFTAAEGVEAARAFKHSTIVPLHCEGWAHFTEHRPEIQQAFGWFGSPALSVTPRCADEFSWSQGRFRG